MEGDVSASAALAQALTLRQPDWGLLFHSDRGVQYASDDYTALLDAALERLHFAIDRDGIALLSAESGCGKSTVLGCLARDLDPTTHLVVYSSLARKKGSSRGR